MTSIQDSLKGDFQQILNYKNDLELLIEDQTQQMEQKNKKIFSFEDVESRHAHEVEQLESRLRVATQQGDESKKKLLQAEVKIRQLTQATLKDMKQKVKEKNAEIEVLKEMVKSANTQIKAKDTDINRLKKRL